MAGSDTPLQEKTSTEAVAQEAAAQAGLRYVSDEEPGFTRKRKGENFVYVDARGRSVRDPAALDRIRKLAIPPAYTDVWICADADGHIQATGRDARGRKQYRYHPRWIETRDADKYGRMVAFGALLPTLRQRVEAHMRRPGLGRRKVLATVVHLLDETLIRVGNEDYARANQSYGLTTLRNRHVDVQREALRFQFKGKSGKVWKLQVRDRRIARIVRQIQDLPGQNLFQYIDREGRRRVVTSGDVNEYLRTLAGEPVTAKDFRTWAGTVMAAMALRELPPFETATSAKKNVKAAIERVAARLGNTPTICRKCYVHPEVVTSYLDARLHDELASLRARARKGLKAEEALVLAFLRKRADQLAAAPKKKRASRKPPSLREQMTASVARSA